MHGRAFSTAFVALVATSLLAAGACSSTPSRAATTRRSGPAALVLERSTYVVPEPLPAGRPGDLVATARRPESAALPHARGTRILYHSTDRNGRDVATSGIVYVPDRAAPAGGWPVVAWGHGTSGVADRCAPSTTDIEASGRCSGMMCSAFGWSA